MKNDFKVSLVHRLIYAFLGSILLIILLRNLFVIFVYGTNNGLAVDLSIIIATLIVFYYGLSVNLRTYTVNDNELIVKDFLRKTKYIPIQNIQKIEEERDGVPVMKHIVLHTSESHKISLLPIQNQRDFINCLGNIHEIITYEKTTQQATDIFENHRDAVLEKKKAHKGNELDL